MRQHKYKKRDGPQALAYAAGAVDMAAIMSTMNKQA